MTDYALRLLMYVAEHPERLSTVGEIATAHDISHDHLMKVTQQLGRLGYVETLRGKGGGLRLARDPAEINLGQVVRDLEAGRHFVECYAPGSRCRLTGRCKLSGVLGGALASFYAHLDGYSLADVLVPIATPRAGRAARTPTSRRP